MGAAEVPINLRSLWHPCRSPDAEQLYLKGPFIKLAYMAQISIFGTQGWRIWLDVRHLSQAITSARSRHFDLTILLTAVIEKDITAAVVLVRHITPMINREIWKSTMCWSWPGRLGWWSPANGGFFWQHWRWESSSRGSPAPWWWWLAWISCKMIWDSRTLDLLNCWTLI